MIPRRAVLLVLAGLFAAPASAAAAAQPLQLRTADGVTIAAMLYQSDREAPAVVLVHMYTRTKDDWRPFAERLQAAGLTALAIDLRGHGASGGLSTPAPAMALDVQAAFRTWRLGVQGPGFEVSRPDGRVLEVHSSDGAAMPGQGAVDLGDAAETDQALQFNIAEHPLEVAARIADGKPLDLGEALQRSGGHGEPGRHRAGAGRGGEDR